MSDVPSDVVARGRAIFERLRGVVESRPTAPTPPDQYRDREPTAQAPVTPADGAADDQGRPEVVPSDAEATDGAADDQGRPEVVPSDAEATESAADDQGRPEVVPSDAEATDSVDDQGQPEVVPSDAEATDSVDDQSGGEHAGSSGEARPETPAASEPAREAPPTDTTDFVCDVIEPDVQVRTVDEPVGDLVGDRVEPVVPAPDHAPDIEETPAAPVYAGRAHADGTPDARAGASPPTNHFGRPLPRFLAIANQKGGVGKTTTAVNLAACLADLGYRVLVADLDPQGNASTGLGINIRDLDASMYDVLLRDTPIEDCIEATSVRNLFVAPSNLDLAGAEIELVSVFSRELKLRSALNDIRDDYDYVVIDCPPSLGLLTVNSLAAASEVLVPIQCEYYALEGLGQLMRNVGLVQKNLNAALELSVIVCVMYDARTKLADQVVQEVRDHFGPSVCRTVIPRTVRLSEAPSYGQPISAFDPTSRGAIAYRELAKEVSGGTA